MLAVCLGLGLLAAWGLPFVRVAPNRLLSGTPVFLAQLMGTPAWLAVVVLVAALLFAVLRPQHRTTQGLVTAGMAASLALLWALAAHHATAVARTESPIARTALGAGFWSLMALGWLICLDAVGRLQLRTLPRLAALALATLPLLALLAMGWGQDLSILKEYANRSDVFGAAMLRHLQIVVLAVLPAVLLGLPLAWAMARARRLRQALFPVLNVVQTLPSIALFGLLMAPLAWLAGRYPLLAQAGISGVGLAPAVLALILYSLLPVVRSALAGLEQVPVAVTTSARAMGLGAWQVFWQVELPLALPVLLVGLRTAVVQTVGLAAVTALVGAGGLGAMMFDGLFSAANELVMLGVLPIVLMAVLADALFKALSALFESPTA
ncbi:ABC transporter permease [Rhodoferax saidenbachensis]|uniref:Osmoprotectant transport system permease protein n=1 Tax=Rhodoferax saidenbachensis TaxID=1484693 RepID=A0ABU1ZKF4_9BURK|nr:ABC transporter permease [Rhodoferax saidenbachensis]MDR7305426.1 osmoprotectant transport system permease protein [Rhodoferax saidenbachensis]